MMISVEDTNREALISKISAIKKGYFVDEFAEEFLQSNVKKDIIINRGYWSRYQSVKQTVEKFLLAGDNESKKQIISMGCGYDTLYFNLKNDHKLPNNCVYIEIDLKSVVQKKIQMINKSQKIIDLLQNCNAMSDNLSSSQYKLFSCDITNTMELMDYFFKFDVDLNVPTFFFAECVLTYIDTFQTDNLIKLLREQFRLIFFLDYGMFKPNDQFGKMMIKNFESRGCPLKGVYEYPDISSQQTRFSNAGYSSIQVYDMNTIYNNYLDQSEKKRIEKLEFLDELEEWIMIQEHYYLLLASNSQQENQLFQEILKATQLKN